MDRWGFGHLRVFDGLTKSVNAQFWFEQLGAILIQSKIEILKSSQIAQLPSNFIQNMPTEPTIDTTQNLIPNALIETFKSITSIHI